MDGSGVPAQDQAATEISQLLYHIQVLMLALDLDLEDVYAQALVRRFASRGSRSMVCCRRHSLGAENRVSRSPSTSAARDPGQPHLR